MSEIIFQNAEIDVHDIVEHINFVLNFVDFNRQTIEMVGNM